ncbi:MAG TPA: thiamine phosphate synthase [Planctomycetaceae bacterium]|nr:thiamine phosphate synthase [Planctomycetaceae bacterium]
MLTLTSFSGGGLLRSPVSFSRYGGSQGRKVATLTRGNVEHSDRRGDADVLRVIDAAGNRAREGLRVLEDYVRFVLDDPHLTRLLKDLRHELAALLADLSPSDDSTPRLLDSATRLLAARDTPGDVGTAIHTASEAARGSPGDVVLANFKRVQEAVRTLEEFGKLLSPERGAALGQLRYRLYTLEKAVGHTRLNRERLADCRLYLLVTSSLCRRDVETVVREALAGGVDVVQLREKDLGDREMLALGRRVREWTREAGALFIMNDRPDLAVLCDADGVHVGQDELTVREARRIVGPDRLVGVSTHTIEQARQAVLDGADSLGVGPVFPSTTKAFDSLAGLEFVREVAGEITLPWFAIGGITPENVPDVLDAGAGRIAVSGAVCQADDPREAARMLARRLALKDGG